MGTDPDVVVDAAVMEVATTWGVRTDRIEPVVDQYGVELVLAAKAQVKAEIASGFAVQSPLGYMISLLRKGVIQAAKVAEEKLDADSDFWGGSSYWYERYHRGKCLKQHDGIAGLGSCSCCSDGGPYAGKPLPEGSQP